MEYRILKKNPDEKTKKRVSLTKGKKKTDSFSATNLSTKSAGHDVRNLGRQVAGKDREEKPIMRQKRIGLVNPSR